jgi:hypothetical protein
VEGVSPSSVDGKPWTCKILGTRPTSYGLGKAADGNVMGASLFCFTVAMPHRPYEHHLVATQRQHAYGIYACDSQMVVSGAIELTSVRELKVIQKEFTQVWDEVRQDGRYLQHDWTVKVEVDAVFFPERLAQHLHVLSPPADASLYIKNSETEGLARPLQVLSTSAMKLYFKHDKICKEKIGHVSDDFYFMMCLDGLGVDHMTDARLSKDFSQLLGWTGEHHQSCMGDLWTAAFYPYRQASSWLACARKPRIEAGAVRLQKYEEFGSHGLFVTRHAAGVGTLAGVGGILVAAVVYIRGRHHRGVREASAQARWEHTGLVTPSDGDQANCEGLVAPAMSDGDTTMAGPCY